MQNTLTHSNPKNRLNERERDRERKKRKKRKRGAANL
jgi:hypothetical protein